MKLCKIFLITISLLINTSFANKTNDSCVARDDSPEVNEFRNELILGILRSGSYPFSASEDEIKNAIAFGKDQIKISEMVAERKKELEELRTAENVKKLLPSLENELTSLRDTSEKRIFNEYKESRNSSYNVFKVVIKDWKSNISDTFKSINFSDTEKVHKKYLSIKEKHFNEINSLYKIIGNELDKYFRIKAKNGHLPSYKDSTIERKVDKHIEDLNLAKSYLERCDDYLKAEKVTGRILAGSAECIQSVMGKVTGVRPGKFFKTKKYCPDIISSQEVFNKSELIPNAEGKFSESSCCFESLKDYYMLDNLTNISDLDDTIRAISFEEKIDLHSKKMTTGTIFRSKKDQWRMKSGSLILALDEDYTRREAKLRQDRILLSSLRAYFDKVFDSTPTDLVLNDIFVKARKDFNDFLDDKNYSTSEKIDYLVKYYDDIVDEFLDSNPMFSYITCRSHLRLHRWKTSKKMLKIATILAAVTAGSATIAATCGAATPAVVTGGIVAGATILGVTSGAIGLIDSGRDIRAYKTKKRLMRSVKDNAIETKILVNACDDIKTIKDDNSLDIFSSSLDGQEQTRLNSMIVFCDGLLETGIDIGHINDIEKKYNSKYLSTKKDLRLSRFSWWTTLIGTGVTVTGFGLYGASGFVSSAAEVAAEVAMLEQLQEVIGAAGIITDMYGSTDAVLNDPISKVVELRKAKASSKKNSMNTSLAEKIRLYKDAI